MMVAVTSVDAAPRRSLVLPLEGNAEPSLRVKLNRIPALSDVPYPVVMEPNLVVEFYSR